MYLFLKKSLQNEKVYFCIKMIYNNAKIKK